MKMCLNFIFRNNFKKGHLKSKSKYKNSLKRKNSNYFFKFFYLLFSWHVFIKIQSNSTKFVTVFDTFLENKLASTFRL